MKIIVFIFILALPVLGGCAATPSVPICLASEDWPGCNRDYYKYKESGLTRDGAIAVCTNRAGIASYGHGAGAIFTMRTGFDACMSEAGFLPCEQGGENLPECQ